MRGRETDMGPQFFQTAGTHNAVEAVIPPPIVLSRFQPLRDVRQVRYIVN